MKLQPLLKGDTWKAARTVCKVGDRSYLVQTDKGKTYRRNRKFIQGQQRNLTAAPDHNRQPVSHVLAGAKTGDTTSTEAEPPELTIDPTSPRTAPDLSEASPIKQTASGRVIKEPKLCEIVTAYNAYIT